MWKVGKENFQMTQKQYKDYVEQATMLKKCLWKVTKRNFQMSQKPYKKMVMVGPRER